MNRLNHNWSEYEIEYLKDNYLKMSNANIARELQRSEAAIQVKKSVMRLTVRNDRKIQITEKRNLLFRLREAVRINRLVYRMKELMLLAENDHNSFRRDKWRDELRRLGEIK